MSKIQDKMFLEIRNKEIFNQAHGPEYLITGKQEEVNLWGLIDSTAGAGDNSFCTANA